MYLTACNTTLSNDAKYRYHVIYTIYLIDSQKVILFVCLLSNLTTQYAVSTFIYAAKKDAITPYGIT